VFVPAFAAWPAALRRPAPPATLAAPSAANDLERCDIAASDAAAIAPGKLPPPGVKR